MEPNSVQVRHSGHYRKLSAYKVITKHIKYSYLDYVLKYYMLFTGKHIAYRIITTPSTALVQS